MLFLFANVSRRFVDFFKVFLFLFTYCILGDFVIMLGNENVGMSSSQDNISDSEYADAESDREGTLGSILAFTTFFAVVIPVMYAISPATLYIIPVFTTLTFVSMHVPHYLSIAFFDIRIYCVAIIFLCDQE